jgi:Carboxypeptidase regulatory-like domain/TonB dependent receptor
MRSLSKSIRVLILALTVFLASVPAFSQTVTGRILGTITDPTSAAIRGATVTITDTQRGTTRTLTTDDSGAYVAPNLQPGVYKVRAESKGFKTVERVNITLEVAQDVAIDLALPPGQATETVVVTEEIPLLNTTTSTLGGTLSNKEINELPLNGRNYENLLQLRPGVVRYPGGGFSTTSSNGLRAEDNAYLIDGLFNSEPFSGQSIINGAGIAGDSATILPIDSIQEFNLQQNPPAEYGWKPGSIVNVGLKSGTNGVHGTAYAFGRDTPLDARNYFNPSSQPKNPRNLEQFGGSIGGPIVKDRVFFFGAYEGQRYTVGNTGLLTTPVTVSLATTTNPAGDPVNSLVDAIRALQAGPNPISNVSLQVGGCTLGPPVSCNGKGFPANDGTNPAGATAIDYGLPNTVSADNAVVKIDDHLSDRNVISGRYFFGNNSGTVSDAQQIQPQWLTQIHTRAQVLGASWTFVASSRLVNEARFGYNRLYQPTFTADHGKLASTYGLDTGVTNPLYGGLPRINIANWYVFPQELGGFNWPKIQGPDTRVQFIDHVSYTAGKHAVKVGGEIHRDAFSGAAYGGVRGRIKFGFCNDTYNNPLEDFFGGIPCSASQLVGDPTRHIHNWGYAGFVQDDWRIAKNFTLNIGLRYELNTVIKEDHNLLGNFDPATGLQQVGQQIKSPFQGNHRNFAPRAGFAWDIGGNGKTVVRGGGGLIYETLNWESYLALNNSLGLATIPTGAAGVSPGGGSIAVGVVGYSGGDPTAGGINWDPAITGVQGTVFPTTPLDCTVGGCGILGVDRNLTTPYVYHWTLGVQHAFNTNLSLEMAYVGNHGANLVGIRDINQDVFANDPGQDGQSGRPFNGTFPFLSNIYMMGNIYKSNYNGLQATLTARNYHGFTFITGYTYSHSLDDVGANWDFGAGLGLPQDSTNPQREYTSSDFDIRHRLTLSLTYALPGRKSFAQLLEGWQLNSIVTLASAQPWGPMDTGTNVSGTFAGNDRWNFFGPPSAFKSGATPTPYFLSGTPPATDPAGPADPAYAINNALCTAHGAMDTLLAFGCYQKGGSAMTPPEFGNFGTMPRNLFRDSGFYNWDFSVAKNWKFGERFGAQFRAEFFNVLNHPNIANPFGGQNGWAHNDPSVPGPGGFGCGCATPDVAASNPVIGSGGSRAVQLGLKLNF